MDNITRCSIGSPRNYYNEYLLYKLFGINAELLINHSRGRKPTTIADVKAYKPESNSLDSGQILHCPYDYERVKLVVQEMTKLLVLDLVDKELFWNQFVLTINYNIENISGRCYLNLDTTEYYGRKIPIILCLFFVPLFHS